MGSQDPHPPLFTLPICQWFVLSHTVLFVSNASIETLKLILVAALGEHSNMPPPPTVMQTLVWVAERSDHMPFVYL